MNQPFHVAHGVSYTPLGAHRGPPTQVKTVWTINVRNEVETFSAAYGLGWAVGGIGWGLSQLKTKRLAQLGVNHHKEALMFAKYVDAPGVGDWHGYPADYRRNPQDRPSTRIMRHWCGLNIMEKHQMGKVSKGQACSL